MFRSGFGLAVLAAQIVFCLHDETRQTVTVCNPALELRHIITGSCRPLVPGCFDGEWKFADSVLLRKFPVDRERRNYVRQVQGALFSLVAPTPLKSDVRFVALSADALQLLDLNIHQVSRSKLFLQAAAGNTVVPDSQPSAHRYGGHQFGSWSGQLGDGRAHLLGEYVNRYGDRWEVQLKGSGRTPYSRHGDGRAVLRSSVREFLVSEAMHHLGIPTSRAVSLVASHDPVLRDQFYNGHPEREPAAVVMRLAPSWFRIGSLELMNANGEFDLLKSTVDFIIEQHFPDLQSSPDKYVNFFNSVLESTVDMVAKWQAVGFAHGVCNTDNFSILSVTIDYGPFGFMDKYDPSLVPNTSDDEGLYQFQNQPNAAKFNLHQLWQALGTLFNDSRTAYRQLERFDGIFADRYVELMRRKLGLLGAEDGDRRMVSSLLEMMHTMFADYTMTWRELSEISLADLVNSTFTAEMWSLPKVAEHDDWKAWIAAYAQRIRRQMQVHADTDGQRQQRMQGINPRYILRNYLAENAIRQATSGNDDEVKQLHKVLQRPFDRQAIAEEAGYASPPPAWSRSLRVSCSS
ncbi:protein adenylyltransferase SelO, mitochondrial-like [Sycon ciliatum]|uniref:protein adenylyltransferase SelO, mitochondrial-like n=1 Tax=Sycon ciliatum TaxID=27933 RepID=UPI0031F6ADD6